MSPCSEDEGWLAAPASLPQWFCSVGAFVVVVAPPLSRVRLSATPWTAARQGTVINILMNSSAVSLKVE